MCFVETESLRVANPVDGGCIVQLETAHYPLRNLSEGCGRTNDKVAPNVCL